MVKKINFQNNSSKIMEVFVEPDAEAFDLAIGQEITIEIENLRSKFNDDFGFELDDNVLTIHQPRQSDIKIYIGQELVFYSLPNRPML